MALTTLTTFGNFIEAHLLKSKLESEGIACFLLDEHMVTLNPLYNVTIGGIKLKVDEKDQERALEIINEIGATAITDEEGREVDCPNCGSNNLASGVISMRGMKGIFSALISFLFMIFPIYYKRVYRCNSCNTQFECE